jgi:DNA-directed RNA polymerase subunit M/transcription elongation factor TFIIS
MPDTMKKCRVCGKEFKASPNDYTVNCPEHRKKLYVTRDNEAARKDSEYMNARFKCPDCGESFDRSGARKHRAETGHTFLPKDE